MGGGLGNGSKQGNFDVQVETVFVCKSYKLFVSNMITNENYLDKNIIFLNEITHLTH